MGMGGQAAFRFIVIFTAAIVVWTPAVAERRVALVMGSNGYETLRPLDNAVSDALAMKDALEALDFEVFLETDRDLRRMRRALEDFVYDAEDADVALVFFAGHGVEVAGENRLLPVDASADTLAALKASSLPLEEVREAVAKAGRIGLIVLDACRHDPFAGAAGDDGRGANALSKPALAASVRPGLGRMGRSENVLYAFAAAPGETAADGEGENSPFTAALVKYLGTGGLEIRSVLTLVQQEVYDFSRGRQLPYVESGLPKTFFAATTAEELPERERLLLAMADVTTQMRDEIERIAADHDMPLAPLFASYLASGARGLSADTLRERLSHAARTYVDLRDELRTLSPFDGQVTEFHQRAEHSLELGAFSDARAALGRAIEIDRRAAAVLEERARARLLSAASSLYLRGRSFFIDGEWSDASADLHEAVSIYRRYDQSLSASGRDWLLRALVLLASAETVLSDDHGRAETLYRERLKFSHARLNGQPDNVDYRLDLARNHLSVARLQFMNSNFGAQFGGETGEHHRQAIRLLTEALRRAPASVDIQHELICAHRQLAEHLEFFGSPQAVANTYRAIAAMDLTLAEAASYPADRLLAMAAHLADTGYELRQFGDRDSVLTALDKSRRILETVKMSGRFGRQIEHLRFRYDLLALSDDSRIAARAAGMARALDNGSRGRGAVIAPGEAETVAVDENWATAIAEPDPACEYE